MKNIDEMEKLAAAATPGPWGRCHHLRSPEHDKSCPCGYRGSIWGGDKEHVVCEMGSTVIRGEEGLEPPRYERKQELINAEFIAASREFVPWACTRMRKLEAVANAARGAIGFESGQPVWSNVRPLIKALAEMERE